MTDPEILEEICNLVLKVVFVAVHRHQMGEVLVVERVPRFVQLPVLAAHFAQHFKGGRLRNPEFGLEILSLIPLAEAKLLRHRLGNLDLDLIAKNALPLHFDYGYQRANSNLHLFTQLLVEHASFDLLLDADVAIA